MYGHANTPDVSMQYSNQVLVKNWYEDRFQEQVASTSGKTSKDLTTCERVTCRDFPEGHPGDFLTTKELASQTMLSTPAPVKVKKPSMYSEATMAEKLQTYGLPKTLQYTLGPNAPADAAKPIDRYLQTTNQRMYGEEPKMATARNPELFATGRSPHATSHTLQREVAANSISQGVSLGGKGARGEITRRPAEAGNVYGVSVFVDEYAKWGSTLKGMPLGETVSRMRTKYF